jgi:WD40 repeat protein
MFHPENRPRAAGAVHILWNATTGADEGHLTCPLSPSGQIARLAFSPDGKGLACVTSAGAVTVWDLGTRRKVYSLSVESSLFTYSPEGKVWAVSVYGAKEDPKARIEIRDTTTGKILRTIHADWYAVAGMTITRDGLLVATGTTNPPDPDVDGEEYDPRGTVQVWEMASGNLVKTSSEFAAVGQVSPDGRFMATSDSSQQGKTKLIVTDLSTGQTKWTFQQSDAAALLFSPDSQELAVTSGGSAHGLKVWSLVTGAAISYVHGERDPGDSSSLAALAFSPDGRHIAAATYPEFSAKIWDVRAGRELREFAGQWSVQALAISPDGKWLVSAAPGVTVRNPVTGKIITTLTIEDADMLLFSPDGRWLAANPGPPLGGMGKSLEVWDTRTWTPVANLTPQPEPRQTLPVRWIAFGGNPSALSELGDAKSLQFTADGQAHTVWFGINPLAASPDGKMLAQTGHPTMNLVDIWNTTSGQIVKTFSAHNVGAHYLAFSADGRSLLTIGQEALAYQTPRRTNEFAVKLWEVATWKEHMSVPFPAIRPPSALLSPDGHRLAVERSREVVDLVDADTGSFLGALAATAPGSFAGWSLGKPNLAFSPNGTRLFHGAKNGIRVWKLPHD